jgi:Sigma-54 interaction domain
VKPASPRCGKALCIANCGAIPTELVEAELFGHEKGAFTGAMQPRSGYFEDADGRTLFLDEIGELPLPAQVKFLRTLQKYPLHPPTTAQSTHSARPRALSGDPKSIEDLPGFPAQALGNMRNLAERSFTIIWNAEFGGRKIPSHAYSYWRQKGVNGVERFESLSVPGELRSQCRVLQLLTGAEQQIDRHAKYISRRTYHLLNSIVGYGHYGQHTDGENVALGTALAAIITSLELAARLTEEQVSAR